MHHRQPLAAVAGWLLAAATAPAAAQRPPTLASPVVGPAPLQQLLRGDEGES